MRQSDGLLKLKIALVFWVRISAMVFQVGKQNEALETLHHAILHKRWKNQWFEPACFVTFKTLEFFFHLGVSKNRGTSKSSILIGFSIIFTIHFGVPLFLETPIFFGFFKTQGVSRGFFVHFNGWKPPPFHNRSPTLEKIIERHLQLCSLAANGCLGNLLGMKFTTQLCGDYFFLTRT